MYRDMWQVCYRTDCIILELLKWSLLLPFQGYDMFVWRGVSNFFGRILKITENTLLLRRTKLDVKHEALESGMSDVIKIRLKRQDAM